MKLHNILLFIPLGYTNARGIIPAIFNLFSARSVDNLNIIIGEGLDSVDPFPLDFGPPAVPLSSFSVGSCGTVTTSTTLTIDELQGLSTIQIKDLQMMEYSFGCVAFEISAGMSDLLTTFQGSLDGTGCNNTFSQDFTGNAGFTNVELTFAFTAKSRFGLLSFELEEVDVTSFDLTWESLDVDTTDLGDFNAALTALSDVIESTVTDAVDTLVDESLLQNALDLMLPFSIP